MRKRSKTAAAATVPQNEAEANGFIDLIGRHQRERDRLELEMNDRLAAIKAEYEEKAAPNKAAIERLTVGLAAWCGANRAILTDGGKVKHRAFAAGEVAWRSRPAKVHVANTDEVLAALHSLDLERFIRTREEIDKQAMLREPEAANQVRGVSVKSAGEDFVVTPFETKLEEVA